MLRHGYMLPPVPAVVPMHAEQVQRVGRIGVDGSEGGSDPLRDLRGVGKLGEGGEEDPRGPEPLGGSLQDRGVGELALKFRRFHLRFVLDDSPRLGGPASRALPPAERTRRETDPPASTQDSSFKRSDDAPT
jgi:hypothetical protein